MIIELCFPEIYLSSYKILPVVRHDKKTLNTKAIILKLGICRLFFIDNVCLRNLLLCETKI